MGEDGTEFIGDSNLEDMHYIMVNVERMKKLMLGKVEGLQDP